MLQGVGPSLHLINKKQTRTSSRQKVLEKNNLQESLDHIDFCAEELTKLQSGSDIRGKYASDEDSYKIEHGGTALLTPTAAYFLGYSFARMVQQIEKRKLDAADAYTSSGGGDVTICVGRDPRTHGKILAEYVCMGAHNAGASVIDIGYASTPSMFEFCRCESLACDGGIMITASHLPKDRNGMKLFTKSGGFTKTDVGVLVNGALTKLTSLEDVSIPDTRQNYYNARDASKYMAHYASTLKNALTRELSLGLSADSLSDIPLPLAGLRIVLNAGNGAGCFFNEVLHDLGADVSASIGIVPDSRFPNGIPNPENLEMVEATINVCEQVNADIGIMLDTDADRCGFVIPRTVNKARDICSDYEPINRNRLIALLSVIFSNSSPGCTIVTDSVTSEGLSAFVTKDLGLQHVRYLKGYANVINKAKELTENGIANAEVAIETSGHCAMKENGYLDDGTYTAVKVIGFLARLERSRNDGNTDDSKKSRSLLDFIEGLVEMPIAEELRLIVKDDSLATTSSSFDIIIEKLTEVCNGDYEMWELDEDNLEGIRIRTRGAPGGFFMLRKSLHDPVISIQIETTTRKEGRQEIIHPLRSILIDLGLETVLETRVLHDF